MKKAPKKEVTLAEVLRYRNKDVVDRFMKEHVCSRDEANEIFKEMLKFIWLAYRYVKKYKTGFALYGTMSSLDDMWHAFILFTRPYSDFCHKYFGEFRHHIPETESSKQVVISDLEREAEFAG